MHVTTEQKQRATLGETPLVVVVVLDATFTDVSVHTWKNLRALGKTTKYADETR